MHNFLTFFILILFSISLNAAVYKGQRVFAKECLPCHTDGLAILSSKDTKTWESLMDKQGTKLAEVHLKDIKAEDSWGYFNSEKYIKKSKHLKQFLMEYASDSGKVPACD